MPTPQPARRPPSVIHAPTREHSRKPDEAYELIERMYPELPKIELFARGRREGWTAWGNEAPDCDYCHGTGEFDVILQTACGTPAFLTDDGQPRHSRGPCPKCRPAEARRAGITLDNAPGAAAQADDLDGIPPFLRRAP